MSVLDNYKCEGQMSIFDLDIWSGKTYPEHLAVTKEKISEPSSKKRQKSQMKMPLFLDLRGGTGHLQDASWETGGALLGEYTMRSFGEYPKEENVSRLSQILEENPHPKYSLSAKACRGILRRAENRGKLLPLMLKNALERQSVSKNEQENPGGGKGILIQNERTGALSTLNNQPVCYGVDAYNHALSGDVAVTLNASSGDSPTHSGPSVMTFNRPAVYQSMYCLNDQGGQIMNVSEDVSGTLRAQEHGHQPVVFEPGAASRVGGHVYDNDVAGTVRANAGDNQQAVVYGISSIEDDSTYCIQGNCIDRSDTAGCNGKGWREDASYTLNTIDRPAVAYRKKEHPQNAELVQSAVCTNYKADGAEGKGIAFATVGDHDGRPTDMTNLVQSESVGAVCQSVVRRLTPLECERLQGYPDGWTDIGEWYDSKGKKHKDADSPRYKALGNSIALPFWHYMASKMVRYLDNPTMASLFDGIGGFPLVFSRCGCEPIWASEIEEFPIAVTKIRFP